MILRGNGYGKVEVKPCLLVVFDPSHHLQNKSSAIWLVLLLWPPLPLYYPLQNPWKLNILSVQQPFVFFSRLLLGMLPPRSPCPPQRIAVCTSCVFFPCHWSIFPPPQPALACGRVNQGDRQLLKAQRGPISSSY